VYSGRHPMSKRTWDFGVVKVIKKGEKRGHCASRGKEMQKTQGWLIHSRSCTPTAGNAVETRRCIGTVNQIFFILNYLIIEVTLFFSVFNLPI